MSVLIKGMEMPRLCGDCPFYSLKKHHPDGVVCKAEIYTDARNTRYDDCPLTEVPVPHGKLIDVDEADKYAYDELELANGYLTGWEAARAMQKIYQSVSPVIEAEE